MMTELSILKTDNPPDLPEGYKMTELGPLPEEWRVVRLGEVVDVMMGQSPPSSTYNTQGEGLPFLQGKAEFGDIHPLPVKWCSAPLRVARRGSVLISVRAPVGDVNLAQRDYCIGRGLAALSGKEGLINDFLFYFLLNAKSRLEEKGTGSTFKSISKSVLQNFPIPLPPLPEQRAIAHVLRAVQRAKEATEQVIAAARELKKSLMRHLFTYGPVPVDQADAVEMQDTEIGPLPAHWRVVRLGEVVEKGGGSIQTGPFGSQLHASDYVSSGVPVVMPRDLSPNGKISSTNISFVREEDKQRLKRHILQKGDLVVARRGELGRRGLVTEDEDGWLCGTGCFRVRPGEYVDSMFLSALFGSNIVRKQLTANAVGTTMANLNARILKNLLVPLPPLSEQREIAHMLQAVDEKIRAEEGRKAALEALFKTLLHDLMTAKRRLPAEFIARFEEAGDESL